MLSATNDENGDELNGATDDEDMEDGEMGFDDGSAQVRNIRDPGQPTAKEHQEHMTTHRSYRPRCKFCVMGRVVNAPHRRFDAQDDSEGVPHVSMDYGFLGEKESEDRVSPVLVIWERRQDDVGYAGSERRNGVSLDRKESSEVRRPTRAP